MSDTEEIKKLRGDTGVSIMAIKEALEEAGGDAEKARGILEKRGAKVAAKKSDRATNAGRIESYIHGDGQVGVLVKVLCETDFVAKNEDFVNLSQALAMQIAAMNPQNVDELMEQQFVKDPAMTVKERIEQTIGKLGENITVDSFSREDL